MVIFVKKIKPASVTKPSPALSQTEKKPPPVAVAPPAPAPVRRTIRFGKPKPPPVVESMEDLMAVGLADGYRPHPALATMMRAHFKPGQRVSVLSPGASRFICKAGDAGVVAKVVPACGMRDKRPDDDLYFVDLESPRTNKNRAYLTFAQLQAL